MADADNDLYLSNGTCYYGKGQVSNSSFIPCGNAAVSGPQPCCWQGDYCLSATACWDNITVVTYLAGCTDPTYTSSKCTNKFAYPDQQWVAIARCEGDDIDIWSGCSHHTDWIDIQKEPDCQCNASEPLIRNSNGKSSLYEIASLPQTAGGTISFNPTAIPTYENAGDTTTSGASPGATNGTTSGGGSSGGLSTGSKAGIGVGAGIGGILMITLFCFLFLLVRRKKKAALVNEHGLPPPETADADAPSTIRTAMSPDLAVKSELSNAEKKLELVSDEKRVELAGPETVSELGTDGVRSSVREGLEGQKVLFEPVSELQG